MNYLLISRHARQNLFWLVIICASLTFTACSNDDNSSSDSPGEVGAPVECVPEQVISDISWTDIHPIKQVYLNYNCNTGQKMWDPMREKTIGDA